MKLTKMKIGATKIRPILLEPSEEVMLKIIARNVYENI
jgi:hypothetical protein